jgi:hypothetical protein
MPSLAEEDTEQNGQDGPFGKVLTAGLNAESHHDKRYKMNRKNPARTRRERSDSMMSPEQLSLG